MQILTNATIFLIHFSCLFALYILVLVETKHKMFYGVCNMALPTSVEYIIIHCGTNNLGHNSPLKITEALINIASMFNKNYKNLHIFVSCLLPRDDEKSVNRSLLYAVNCYLKDFCTNEFHYIELDSGWTLNNHLNNELFRKDNLHLNRKVTKSYQSYLSVKLSPFKLHFGARTQNHQETTLKQYQFQ